MKIKKMRWGYDGGGIACGPVDGSVYYELTVEDENMKTVYICASTMDCYARLNVTEESYYDAGLRKDFDTVLRIMENSIEDYDYDETDIEENAFADSRYFKAIQILRSAMYDQEYMVEDMNDDTAEKFIKPYLDKDLNSVKAPVLNSPYKEDEDDGEDE